MPETAAPSVLRFEDVTVLFDGEAVLAMFPSRPSRVNPG